MNDKTEEYEQLLTVIQITLNVGGLTDKEKLKDIEGFLDTFKSNNEE